MICMDKKRKKKRIEDKCLKIIIKSVHVERKQDTNYDGYLNLT